MNSTPTLSGGPLGPSLHRFLRNFESTSLTQSDEIFFGEFSRQKDMALSLALVPGTVKGVGEPDILFGDVGRLVCLMVSMMVGDG